MATDRRIASDERPATAPVDGAGPIGGEATAQAPDASSARSRKEDVLTRQTASVVRSISDAVVAKDGEPFFLCPPDGQVVCGGGHGYGLYHHDCRFLDGYELRIAGSAPNALAASEAPGSRVVIELTNAELRLAGDRVVRKEQLGITWLRTLDGKTPALADAIEIRNYGREGVVLPVDLRFACGFEDVFTIRGLLSVDTGEREPLRWDGHDLVFGYHGRDGIDRILRLTFHPRPDSHEGDRVRLLVRVPARAAAEVRVTATIVERARPGYQPIERRDAPDEAMRDAEVRSRRTPDTPWIGDGWQTSVRTSSLVLDAALDRSLSDLYMLRATLGGRRYYEAGIPWFATLFGRDALITAYQTLAFDAEPAAETLRLLAARQGQRHDDWRDEAPGKILHELRIGELARLGEIPHTPYYGSVDATPLFLILLGRHAAWTGRLDLFEELRDAVQAALGWLERSVDAAEEGFIGYKSDTEHGLVNQGWKDSGDAIIDHHGDIARPPIAMVEVQAYAYRAWLEIASLLDRAGDARASEALRDRARHLRRRFEERFWSERLGSYVMALTGGGPCEVLSSNAGHALWAGIADPDRAARLADGLMGASMFSGWGVRTLSSDAAGYNPIGYHLGTVWPHDNALIADGLRRYGLDSAAERIFVATLEAAQHFPHARLPECISGYERADYGVPVRYPVACHPQAWAAGALPALLVTSLGLKPDAFARQLRIVRPRLPGFVHHVELRGVPVGDARAHLRFDGRAGMAEVTVADVEGDLDIVVDESGHGHRDERS
jgi:glycogen debranching enzyme